MMTKKLFLSAACLLAVLCLQGCAALNTTIQEMKTFAKCDFRLATVENIKLAGVNVQQVRSLQDLSLLDAGKITAALAQGNLPLNLTLNVEVKNPNPTQASMSRFDWILFIDGTQMLEGTNEQRIEVAANNGSTVMPLAMQIDLKKALSGKSGEAIANFGLNLAGTGNKPTRFLLKVKPSIMVGSTMLTYPGYIDVKEEFSGIK